jgi:hypothetical protein
MLRGLSLNGITGHGALNALEHRFCVGQGVWQQFTGLCDPVVQQLVEHSSNLIRIGTFFKAEATFQSKNTRGDDFREICDPAIHTPVVGFHLVHMSSSVREFGAESEMDKLAWSTPNVGNAKLDQVSLFEAEQCSRKSAIHLPCVPVCYMSSHGP